MKNTNTCITILAESAAKRQKQFAFNNYNLCAIHTKNIPLVKRSSDNSSIFQIACQINFRQKKPPETL